MKQTQQHILHECKKKQSTASDQRKNKSKKQNQKAYIENVYPFSSSPHHHQKKKKKRNQTIIRANQDRKKITQQIYSVSFPRLLEVCHSIQCLCSCHIWRLQHPNAKQEELKQESRQRVEGKGGNWRRSDHNPMDAWFYFFGRESFFQETRRAIFFF